MDTALGDVNQGLSAIDDFGFIAASGDNAANFDAGTGGGIAVQLSGGQVILPDGVAATGTLGPTGATTPGEADAALDGCEILIFEDAELSGVEIALSSPTNNIVIGLNDRQINPNAAAGADDTLICIDLDSLPGFDGTFIDTISITDAGVTMTDPPILWGDTSLEIDAIATRKSVIGTGATTLNGFVDRSAKTNGMAGSMAFGHNDGQVTPDDTDAQASPSIHHASTSPGVYELAD